MSLVMFEAPASKSGWAGGPPWLTLSWVILTAGLWLSLGPAPTYLAFDRTAIASGEVWRLLTGHLVHGDALHALGDITALAILGWLLEGRGRLRLACGGMVGLAAVNLGLWWGLSFIERYCGLSGVLHTLLVVVLADLWRSQRHPAILFAALGLILKLALEIASGQTLLDTLWPPLPEAHLVGCLGGFLFLLLERAFQSPCQLHVGCGEHGEPHRPPVKA